MHDLLFFIVDGTLRKQTKPQKKEKKKPEHEMEDK